MGLSLRARDLGSAPACWLAVATLGVAAPAPAADLLTFVEAEPMPAIANVQATAVAVSPDGDHLYATAGKGNALVTFDRDPGTGQLTFVQTLLDGVDAQGLEFVGSVVVSPDGEHVYTAATGIPGPMGVSSVAAFSRDAVSGALTFLEAEFDGVDGVVGLQAAHRVDISPDGAHVYVAAASSDAVLVFERDTSPGATFGELTFVEAVFDGQNGVDGLDAVLSAVVSPDGAHVYTAAFRDDAVAVFARNATTGTLTFVEAIFDTDLGVDGLDGSSDVTVSPTGSHVYSVSQTAGTDGEDALVTFERNASSGELTWLDVQFDGVDGVDGISRASSVLVHPGGSWVFVAGFGDPPGTGGGTGDNALAAFRRYSTSGRVDFAEAQFDGVDGVDGLEGARWVDVSPDGRHVYVAGVSDAKVAVFALAAVGVPSLGIWGLGALGSMLMLAAVAGLARDRPRRGR